jgi:hypothetical protein
VVSQPFDAGGLRNGKAASAIARETSMSPRFGYGRMAMFAATACIGLASAPPIASAQSQGPDYDNGGYQGQGGTYYDQCKRSQVDRSVIGGVLGAVAGATLGNSVTHGGAKLGGALIGGAAGAAGGAAIGHASAACDSGQDVPYASGPPPGYGDSQYAPPPPAPPPPGAYIPPDDGRYAERDGRPDYAPPPPPRDDRCQMVEDRVFFPDGTTDSSTVRACRDDRGRWRVED